MMAENNGMLDGKVVVITGAGRGLGQAYAVAFAAAGAAVVAADLDSCDETVALASRNGGRCIGVAADVTDAKAVDAMADAAVEAFGGIDALVNNAALYGALHGGRFDSIDDGEWDAAMNVNVKGIWYCCRAVVPKMRERGGGSIVNVASLAATYGMPYGLHYSTSKAAVIGLTRALAREIGRNDIRVNAIAPTAVITEGTREFFGPKYEGALDTIKSGQAIPRNPEADDMVGTVMWLISDASKFVTGQTISIDGGTVLL
jgi:3-oxoacyl-[acyl-carrier protein] reductase